LISLYHAETRVQLEARQIDTLIDYGMGKFSDAGIYISPSKMSKLVKDALRSHGYALARLIIEQYFENATLLEWESYSRALRGAHV
jgi:hypothetical protein